EARGMVELRTTQRARRPAIVDVGARSSRPALNAAQSAALSSITGAVDRSEHAELLLHGVTGSGKTEVYLAAAEAVLARGRGAIALPEVDVLDMRTTSGESGPLHAQTVRALSEIRDVRGKAIVMLNRRGWSPFVSCRSCGRGWGCPECDVSLVVHKGSGRLRC